MAVRTRNRLFSFKHQPAVGTPAVPTAADDAILMEEDGFTISPGFRLEETTEVSGSLDAGAPQVVGAPATFSFNARMRGSGAVYTALNAPRLGRLLEVCGWEEVFSAAVAATALTAGTATSATLATPFAATAQLYRGQPLLLSGANHAGALPVVLDYTSGRVATLSDTFAPALATADSAALPANYLYRPFTDSSGSPMAVGTAYIYEDGFLYEFTDCRGTFTLDVTTGSPGTFTFNMTGIFAGRTQPGMPAGAAPQTAAAPFFRQGANPSSAFLLDRAKAAITSLSLASGNNVASSPDPNTAQGFGSADVTGRDIRISIDPQLEDLATRDLIADLQAGTVRNMVARWGDAAGSRMFVSMPQGRVVEYTPGEIDAKRSEQITLDALGENSGAFICFA